MKRFIIILTAILLNINVIAQPRLTIDSYSKDYFEHRLSKRTGEILKNTAPVAHTTQGKVKFIVLSGTFATLLTLFIINFVKINNGK